MPKAHSAPYVEMRNNGVYYVYYYNKAKRRWDKESLHTDDMKVAMGRFQVWLAKAYNFELGARVDGDLPNEVTCGQVLDYYKENKIDREAADPYSLTHKQKWTREFFGNLPVAKLNQNKFWEYVDKRKAGLIGRGAKGPAVRVELKQLLTAIQYAQDKHAFDKALLDVAIPKLDLPPASQPRDAWFTQQQLHQLFETCKWETDRGGSNPSIPNRMSRTYRWAVLAYYTAARREALENLTWSQVRFDTMTINLLPTGERQTSKRRVPVPITSEYASFMREMWGQRESDMGYVLDRPADLYYPITRALRWADLSWATPHALRHTRAVHLAQAGVSLYTIAGLLGDTVKTVEKNYLHHCPDHIRRAIEAGQEDAVVDLESIRDVSAGPVVKG